MLTELDWLRSWVEIRSGSENPFGISRVQELLAQELQGLGFRCRWIEPGASAPHAARLLVSELAGPGGRFIDLVCHADTIGHTGERPSLAIRGDLATGAGVADDKGGMVVMISALRSFLGGASRSELPGLRVICSPSEELGSPGFQDHLRSLSKSSSLVLGFEPSLEDGSIIHSRRGNRWYQVEVEGCEAHSGRAYESGASAAHELILKLSQIQRLTQLDRELTVSVGSLKSARDCFNVICGHAEAKVDLRFPDSRACNEIHKKIVRILSRTFARAGGKPVPTQTRYRLADDCPAFSESASSKRLGELYRGLIGEIEGKPTSAKKSGGAADSCYMSRPGLPVLDGLGPIGGGLHSNEEWVSIPSLRTRAQALSRFLSLLGPLERERASHLNETLIRS